MTTHYQESYGINSWRCDTCGVFWRGKQRCFICGELGRHGATWARKAMTVTFKDNGDVVVKPGLS